MSSINSIAPDLIRSQGLATVPQVPQIPQMQAPTLWVLRGWGVDKTHHGGKMDPSGEKGTFTLGAQTKKPWVFIGNMIIRIPVNQSMQRKISERWFQGLFHQVLWVFFGKDGPSAPSNRRCLTGCLWRETFWNRLGLPNLDYINSFHLFKKTTRYSRGQ